MEENEWLSMREGQHTKWHDYERLDESVDKIDELLRKYRFELAVNDDDWVAALFPYASNVSLLPKIRGRKLNYLISKMLPNNAKQLFFENIYKDKDSFFDEQSVDEGFIFREKSLHVQNCIKNLVENALAGEREGKYANTAYCDASIGDSMGMYLLHGVLYGQRDNGRILLQAKHPVLRPFNVLADKFRYAYREMLVDMKIHLDEKDLKAVNGMR
jgi:hypothetical protein